MKDFNMIVAGFGGQGVLFAGKVISYCGLLDGKEVSWLPSYGPEMRGGTANCSICVSSESIGSPLVTTPDILIAMNLPSLTKFIGDVVPGGVVIVDSSLVDIKVERTDVSVYYVPSSQLSSDNRMCGLANIILIGKLLKETEFVSLDIIQKALDFCVPASKPHLFEMNKRAIQIGMEN